MSKPSFMRARGDEPEYRKLIDEVIAWLADGRELAQLEKLVKDIKAQPRKRSSTNYKVKRPDGSVVRPLVHTQVRANAPSRRQLRVVGVPRNPILKLAEYIRTNGVPQAAKPKGRRVAPSASAHHVRRSSRRRPHSNKR